MPTRSACREFPAAALLSRAGRQRLLAASLLSLSCAALADAPVEGESPPADLTEVPIEALVELQVFSASRFEQKLGEAPSAVRVITAAEIRDFGWRTLDQALASLPGVYTSYDRSYAYLGSRGFLRPGDYITRFLLLVNGTRINDPVYDQAGIGGDFVLDLDLVDRIEFVPGPGSSGYGANAFFGVINVITRAGRDYPKAEARAEGGSDGHASLAARYGRQGHGGEILLAASGFRREGEDLFFPEFDAPDTNNGIADGLDYERARRFLVTGSHGALRYSLIHAVRVKGDPTASFGQLFNDPRSDNRDERTLLDVGYVFRATSDLQVTAHAFAGRYAYDGKFIFEPAPGPVNYDGSRAVWTGFGIQAVTTAWKRQKVLFGIDAQYDVQRDVFNYDAEPRLTYLDTRTDNRRVGIFVEDELTVREGLLVNAGIRLDHDGVTGAHVSPRLALIHDSGHGSNIKAIVGTAYRSPNLYEELYTATYAQSTVELDAERISAQELVWTKSFGPRTTLMASLFNYRLRNLIDETADEEGNIFFQNRGRARTRGLEVSLDHLWEGGTALRASYTYARADDPDSDARLENSPRHLAKLNLSTPIPGSRARAGIEARHVGTRQGEFARIDSYQLVNATVTWPSRDRRLELSATVQNLLDERYADPAGAAFAQNGIEQDGRTWLLRAIYRF